MYDFEKIMNLINSINDLTASCTSDELKMILGMVIDYAVPRFEGETSGDFLATLAAVNADVNDALGAVTL